MVNYQKNNMMKQKYEKNKCITCNREFDIELDTKPFCSKRCSYIDLNNWLGEKYSIESGENDYDKDV